MQTRNIIRGVRSLGQSTRHAAYCDESIDEPPLFSANPAAEPHHSHGSRRRPRSMPWGMPADYVVTVSRSTTLLISLPPWSRGKPHGLINSAMPLARLRGPDWPPTAILAVRCSTAESIAGHYPLIRKGLFTTELIPSKIGTRFVTAKKSGPPGQTTPQTIGCSRT